MKVTLGSDHHNFTARVAFNKKAPCPLLLLSFFTNKHTHTHTHTRARAHTDTRASRVGEKGHVPREAVPDGDVIGTSTVSAVGHASQLAVHALEHAVEPADDGGALHLVEARLVDAPRDDPLVPGLRPRARWPRAGQTPRGTLACWFRSFPRACACLPCPRVPGPGAASTVGCAWSTRRPPGTPSWGTCCRASGAPRLITASATRTAKAGVRSSPSAKARQSHRSAAMSQSIRAACAAKPLLTAARRSVARGGGSSAAASGAKRRAAITSCRSSGSLAQRSAASAPPAAPRSPPARGSAAAASLAPNPAASACSSQSPCGGMWASRAGS